VHGSNDIHSRFELNEGASSVQGPRKIRTFVICIKLRVSLSGLSFSWKAVEN
jgi:hypothetical protein